MGEPILCLFRDAVVGQLDERTPEGDVVPPRGRARFSGALLRQRRIRAGLTLEDLAVLVGVTQSAVSAWEHGQANPRSAHLASLAATLDVTTADLYASGVQDLVALRKLAGLSRAAAAEVAQVSLSSMARYERGTAAVPGRVRGTLAAAYDVDESTLAAACDVTIGERVDLASARRARRH